MYCTVYKYNNPPPNTYVQRTVIDSEALIAVQHVFHSIADDTQHTRAEFERLQPFEPHLAWLVQQAQQPSVDAAHMQRYLGRIYAYSYRHELALESYGAALGLYRAVGAKLGEANVLKAMGDVQQFRDERDAALESYGAALGLYRVVGDRLGEANVLKAMGDVQQFRDERDAALESYGAALGLYRVVGAKLGEANVLVAMGDVQQFRDERDAALESYGAALGLYRVVGDRLGEANVLKAMGDVQQFRDERDAALESYGAALGLYRVVGDRGKRMCLKRWGMCSTWGGMLRLLASLWLDRMGGAKRGSACVAAPKSPVKLCAMRSNILYNHTPMMLGLSMKILELAITLQQRVLSMLLCC